MKPRLRLHAREPLHQIKVRTTDKPGWSYLPAFCLAHLALPDSLGAIGNPQQRKSKEMG
jgi:hypothetical protein